MQTKTSNTWIKHIDFMLVDIFSIIISFTLSYRIKFGDYGFVHSGIWLGLLITIVFLNIIICIFLDTYSGIFRRSYYQEIIRAFRLTLYNFIVASVLFYAFKIGINYSRIMLFLTYSCYFLLSLVLKYLWKKLIITKTVVTNSTKPTTLFIVSDKETINSSIHDVTTGDFNIFEIKGIYLVKETEEMEAINGIPLVQNNYVDFVLRNNIQEVLITVSPSWFPKEAYEQLTKNGVEVNFVIDSLIGYHSEEQSITYMGIYQTLSTRTFSFSPSQSFYLMIKRPLDIVVSLIGIVFLIPITIFVKAAFLVNGDKNGIFYKQKRIGLNGKQIEILKYRSMVSDADALLEQMLKEEKYRTEWEKNQKLENDPRITSVGKFLRRTSLDELPQLINVLKGDMSIVGPRPLVAGELEAHNGLKLYQKVRPGITGWWGCNGRSNIDYKERLELEYYYVKHCSLYLDLLCIFRTVLAVLKKEGAK